MNDFATRKSEGFASHFDIVRRIETMCSEVPYAIKQFRTQVAGFRSMDKRLVALKQKAERKANTKILDKLDSYIIEYQGAYRKCVQSYADINKALDEIAKLYSLLADHYSADGRRKESKRAVADGKKFDKVSRRDLTLVFDKLNSVMEIDLAKEGKAEPQPIREERPENSREPFYREENREQEIRRQRDEAARHSYNAQQNPGAHYQQAPYGYPQHDYRMMPPPPFYQPMPSLSIAPISIDVNSAVDSLFDNFTKAFEAHAREYISNYELPTPEAKPSAVSEEEKQAVDKIVEDEGFALEKMAALLEKMGNMLSLLSELTAKYSELEDKAKAISDSLKSATDTQRTLARELQGIQATQKVINGDQLKLAEEQTIVVEAQKLAISRQTELCELEKGVSEEMQAMLDGASKNAEGFRTSAAAQNGVADALLEIMSANDKLLDLQKNLEERQSELTEMQRDALLAHKKLTRSQKAVNERLGAKTGAKKEKSEVVKLTPPETENTEILDEEKEETTV